MVNHFKNFVTEDKINFRWNKETVTGDIPSGSLKTCKNSLNSIRAHQSYSFPQISIGPKIRVGL